MRLPQPLLRSSRFLFQIGLAWVWLWMSQQSHSAGEPGGAVKVVPAISLAASLRAAEKAHRPYWIESVVCLVDILDLPLENPTERRSTFRFVYTLHLLRDISFSERTFQESLHNYFGRERILWSGSIDPVDLQTKGPETTFEVILAGKKGDLRTVTTGMTIVERLPLGPRSLRGFDFGPRDYAIFYPNSEDYIGQLTLILSSSTTRLKAGDRSVWRLPPPKADPWWGTASVSAQGDAVRATLDGVKPGEVVALRFAW